MHDNTFVHIQRLKAKFETKYKLLDSKMSLLFDKNVDMS